MAFVKINTGNPTATSALVMSANIPSFLTGTFGFNAFDDTPGAENYNFGLIDLSPGFNPYGLLNINVAGTNLGSGDSHTAIGDGLELNLGAGSGGSISGNGGRLSLNSGSATTLGDGGEISINTGNGAGATGSGGNLNVNANSGSFNGGAMNFNSGSGGTGIGGNIGFSTGGSGSNNAGDFIFNGGTGSVDGGDFGFQGGLGGSGFGGGFFVRAGNSTAGNGGLVSLVAGDGPSFGGQVSFNGGNGGIAGGDVRIAGGVGATNGSIIFVTGGVEQGRFDSAGNLGIGTAAPIAPLDVTNIGTDSVASFTGTSGTCTVRTDLGTLDCPSDRTLKTNIMTISGGLDTIMSLQGVTYNWNSTPGGVTVPGFIAQDVEKVLPNLVTHHTDGTLSLSKDGILPYLVEAVKTQNAKLDDVNKQLAEQGIQIVSISDELKALSQRVDKHDKQLQDQQSQIDTLTNLVEKQSKAIEQLQQLAPQITSP